MIKDQYEPGLMTKLCRACSHSFYWHDTKTNDSGDHLGEQCVKKYDPPLMDVWKACSCPKYIPLNNLEYLEMKYKEKQCL